MKKIKNIIACSTVLAGAAMGLIGCGEVYIHFDTEYGSPAKIEYDKDSYKSDVDSVISDLGVTKPGYRIAGVYLDEEYKTPFTATSLADVKKDVTLYIKWELATIDVIYNANGGTGTIANTPITYTQNGTLSNDTTSITREGYTFVGWNTAADGSGQNYSSGAAYDMDSTSPVTLYAMWSANKYNVVYDKNAASAEGVALVDGNAVYDSNFIIKANTYTRVGYTFDSWNTKADGTGTKYSAGDSVKLSSTGTILYAQWKANNYKINFVKGGSAIEGNAIAQMNCDYDSTFTIPAEEYIRPGFTQVGWRIEGTGDILEAGDIITMTRAEDIDLYPIWEISNLPYNAADIADLYTDYTEEATQYDYAVIKGVTYSFPNATIVSVSDTSAASIVSNQLVINTAGTFTIRIQSTADVNNVWDFDVIAKDNAYTITYTSDSSDIGIGNQMWDNPNDTTGLFNYTYDTAKTLQELYKPGYTFTGWKLKSPAVIDGVKRLAGYNIGTSIPANSFGNIQLDATYTINSYKISAYDYNFATSTYSATPILEMTGTFKTNWTTATGYSEDALYDSIRANTKAGYVFIGWYTAADGGELFDGEISFGTVETPTDGRIYARYVEKLDVPTNVKCDATVITWNAVAGAESYIIEIAGEEYETKTNSFDTTTQLIGSGDKEVRVKAVLKFEETGKYGYVADASSEYSTATIVTITGEETIIAVRKSEDESLQKYVFFTNRTYNIVDTSFTNNYTVEDNDNIVEASEPTEQDNGMKTAITTSDKTGTFLLKRGNKTVVVQVVENVATVEVGESILNFKAGVAGSLDQEADSVSNEYQVGSANGFKFDISVKDSLGDNFSNYDFADSEAIVYQFKVYNGEEWINADTAYYSPSAKTISTTQGTDGISLAVERDATHGEYFNFNSAIGAYDIAYQVDVYMPYIRNSSKAIYFDSNNNLDVTKSGLEAVLTFDIAVNSGVNVYTNQELKDAYGDMNIHIVNIHRDITAELSAEQTHADGTPNNVESRNVFDSKYNLSTFTGDKSAANISTTAGVYKTDGNIYKRADNTTTTADRIVINGNHCTIDASGVARINTAYSTKEGDSEEGENRQTGTLSNGMNFTLAKSQIGVFRYQMRKAPGSVAIFNNITINSNKLTSDQEAAIYTKNGDNTAAAQQEIEEKNSASMSAIFAENSGIILNNCTVSNACNAVRNDSCTGAGDVGSGYVYNSTTELNYTKVNNTYMSSLYGWNGLSVKVFNSEIINQGGLPIHLADTKGFEAIVPTIYIDTNSKIENYITGDESWFKIFNFSTLAGLLKSQLQGTIQTFHGSALKNLGNTDGVEFINVPFVYIPEEAESDDHAKKYGVQTHIGGTKKIMPMNTLATDEHKDQFAGYEYNENGDVIGWYYLEGEIVSTKNMDMLAAEAGVRANDQGMYAFTLSEHEQTAEFGLMANQVTSLVTELLTGVGTLMGGGTFDIDAFFVSKYTAYADNPSMTNAVSSLQYACTHTAAGAETDTLTSTLAIYLLGADSSKYNETAANLVKYILYNQGIRMNADNNDMMLEVIYPMPSTESGNSIMPMVIYVTTGTGDELETADDGQGGTVTTNKWNIIEISTT